MIIGIIGAGIAGLTAGRRLAQAGHEVIVFEKSKGFGGRMATRYAGETNEIKTDHGTPFFTARGDEFRSLVSELENRDLVQVWDDHFPYFTGEMVLEKHPDLPVENYWIAPGGMNTIGRYLSRWVDVRLNTRVLGFTYLGDFVGKKRNWMINIADFSVMEVDAVIVATPAPQAYGLIENAQDETPFKKIIRDIDVLNYEACHTLMVNLGEQPVPGWKALRCKDPDIRWITNESGKRDNKGNNILVVQSTAAFSSGNLKSEANDVTARLLRSLSRITGINTAKNSWTQLHFWKYRTVRNAMPGYFVEPEDHPAPAALIGDYFGGADVHGMESAYLSGYMLAEHWLQKYPR